MSNLQTIRLAFERIAERYEHHAALEQEVCSRLLERTAFNRRAPAQILDLGCGTGAGSAKLKQMFRKAQVTGLDTSMGMLSRLRRRSGMLKPIRGVCGDIGSLPFATRSADMLFSNLATYWCPDPMAMFSEFRRVLRPDGMLLFSTLGPETLRELKAVWAGVDEQVELPEFPDLMEIGNALVAAGFREPVMDMEVITLSYPDLPSMLEELEATGNALLVRGWDRRLGSESALEQAYSAFGTDGKYPLSFEIIYGVAFGPQDGQPVKTPGGDVATFSVDALRRSRKVP
ncbi:methyltransferase domain-containing protein [Pseudomonadota bacterium]